MGIWDNFFTKTKLKTEFTSKLHEKIHHSLPDHSEEDILITACLAGMLARIAYVDFDLDPNEKDRIKKALEEVVELSSVEAEVITSVTIAHIKELSGLENHCYSHPISEKLSVQQRYKIVELLFTIAAADGSVSEQESEEIRTITKSLLLVHKHFIAARAKVMDKLACL